MPSWPLPAMASCKKPVGAIKMQDHNILSGAGLSSWPVARQVRDLSIIALNNRQSLVIACDSAGAIGPKELDRLKVRNYILGRFTTRVALLEVLSAGAVPMVVCNTLAVEMRPSGEEILSGIRSELEQVGYADRIHLTGSTEENFPTRQSGLGITVIGLAATENLRLGRARAGDEVWCFGLPKVGSEVQLGDPEIVEAATVLQLLACPVVHELIPVGSKGILYEALALAGGKQLRLNPDCGLPLQKSAGPATCLIAAVEPAARAALGRDFRLPVTRIGWIGD